MLVKIIHHQDWHILQAFNMASTKQARTGTCVDLPVSAVNRNLAGKKEFVRSPSLSSPLPARFTGTFRLTNDGGMALPGYNGTSLFRAPSGTKPS